MKFIKYLVLFSFLGVVLRPLPVASNEQNFRDGMFQMMSNLGLLSSEEAPSLREIIERFNGEVPEALFSEEALALLGPTGNTRTGWSHKGTFFEEIPPIVTRLEFLYPGATWIMVGGHLRDIGFQLEAVYEAMGLSGRVIYLDGENNSFQATHDEAFEDMADYLEAKGMKVSGNAHPYIFLGMPSSGSSSEFLLRAAYIRFVENGFKPEELGDKINLVSVTSSGVTVPFHNRVGVEMRQDSQNRQNLDEHRVPHLFHSVLRLNESKLDTQSLGWHRRYGKIGRDDEGRSRVRIFSPGQDDQVRFAQLILAIQFLGWAGTEAFHERLKEELELLRMKDPFVSRPMAAVIVPISPEKREAEEKRRRQEKEEAEHRKLEAFTSAMENLKATIKTLPPREEEKKQRYFSTNASTLNTWLHNILINQGDFLPHDMVRVGFLEGALVARKNNLIGDRDIRRMTAMIFGELSLTDDILSILKGMINNNSILYEIVTKKAWRFYDGATKNFDLVGQAFDVIKDRILIPMKCQLVLTKPNDDGQGDQVREKPEWGSTINNETDTWMFFTGD